MKMSAIIVLDGNKWNWICGTPDGNNSSLSDWESVRNDSCFANFLLLIPHVLFFFLFILIAVIVSIRKSLRGRTTSSSSSPILFRYPGHVQRWILNVLYLVVLLVSLGEGVLSDHKIEGPTQPHLYVPQACALLTGISTTFYYHVMETHKKSKMVYALLLYWVLAMTGEAYRMTTWVESMSKIDLTVIRFDVIALVLLAYALYIYLEIVIIAKKVSLNCLLVVLLA